MRGLRTLAAAIARGAARELSRGVGILFDVAEQLDGERPELDGPTEERGSDRVAILFRRDVERFNEQRARARTDAKKNDEQLERDAATDSNGAGAHPPSSLPPFGPSVILPDPDLGVLVDPAELVERRRSRRTITTTLPVLDEASVNELLATSGASRR